MKKKSLVIITCSVLVLSVVGCDATQSTEESTVEAETKTEEDVETETETEETGEEDTEITDTSSGEEPMEESDEEESTESEAESYYNLTMTLTKKDCTKDSLGFYSYNGITFLEDDSDWIDSPLNSNGTINAGSFYRKLQSCLQYFSVGNAWQSYAKHIIGYTPESRDEFEPYVEEFLTYMTDSMFGNSMMSKFQTIENADVVQNDADYTCVISDVNDCAEELNISAEMLGYILGGLHDCGAKITFNGNTCVIEYHDYS